MRKTNTACIINDTTSWYYSIVILTLLASNKMEYLRFT